MEPERLLDVRKYFPWLEGEGWRKMTRRGLERLLGLPRIWEIEEELEQRASEGEEPFAAFLAAAGIGIAEEGVCKAIPREGPGVVIANHPFGGADALALSALCKRVRTDMRILANGDVEGIKAISPWLMPLEVMGEEGSERKNLRVLRDALGHIRSGGLLVIFPAGAVSYWQHATARVEDPPWPDHTARMIGKANAPVLPVRFFGRNHAWWQVLAKVHPYLRSGFIPRAMLAMRGETVRCAAGPIISPGAWPDEIPARTRFLREAVENVG